jgi:DNA-binding NtrC family response regulator
MDAGKRRRRDHVAHHLDGIVPDHAQVGKLARGDFLEQAADAGRFRADLYYRLNVLPIRLPALRERMADLEALVESLSEDIARRSGMPARSVSPEALALLARRDWPGNIRELRNTLEQAALMTDDLVL